MQGAGEGQALETFWQTCHGGERQKQEETDEEAESADSLLF